MGTGKLPSGGIRFTLPGLRGFVFRRYPIEVTPEEGTVGFVNNDRRQTGAGYSDGAWRNKRGKPITWEPTHWTIIENDKP